MCLSSWWSRATLRVYYKPPCKAPALEPSPCFAQAQRSQCGAAMLELAIAVPVLLLLLTAIMYLAHLMSARAAITTAVNSVRIAATRAHMPVPTKVFQEIEGFNATGNASKHLQTLLASKELENAAFSTSGKNSYNDFLKDASQFPAPAPELMKLEKEDLISMIYAIGIVRQSLGNHVKTPCQEPGCLLCLPVPPPWADAPPGLPSTFADKPVRAHFAGIRCEYRPDGFISSVLNSLNGFMNPGSGDLSPIIFYRQQSVVFNGWGKQG